MALPLQNGEWSLDPAHSVVEFAVRHLGISTIRGRFGGVEASVVVGSDLGSSSLAAEVDMSSVDTGNADRDTHLRSTDFFDVDTQPKMVFASTSMTQSGDEAYEVVGDLTINGQTHSETLSVTFSPQSFGALMTAWLFLPAVGFARTSWGIGILLMLLPLSWMSAKRRVGWVAVGVVCLAVALFTESGVGRTRIQTNTAMAMVWPNKVALISTNNSVCRRVPAAAGFCDS